MRALITGAAGFVGPYLIEALHREYGSNIEIHATSKLVNRIIHGVEVFSLDVLDAAAVKSVIREYRPSHIWHLAAMAAPRHAQADPDHAWQLHVMGTLNLARSILELAPETWLINVGSGMVYGETAKHGRPVDEEALLAPIDEYAATKSAADLAIGALTRSGLKSVRLRPFNHTGPGQTVDFVVPALAHQITRIEKKLAPPVIRVGNLDSERDFLDVRDVARAYALVALKCQEWSPGVILNIASGATTKISDILEWFLKQSPIDIKIEHELARVRQTDLPRIVGNASRARQLLGWAPQYQFEETLQTILADFRRS